MADVLDFTYYHITQQVNVQNFPQRVRLLDQRKYLQTNPGGDVKVVLRHISIKPNAQPRFSYYTRV